MTQLMRAVNLRRVSHQIPSPGFVDSRVLFSFLTCCTAWELLNRIFEPGAGLTTLEDEQVKEAWPLRSIPLTKMSVSNTPRASNVPKILKFPASLETIVRGVCLESGLVRLPRPGAQVPYLNERFTSLSER
jgi:hypothetical protein